MSLKGTYSMGKGVAPVSLKCLKERGSKELS